MTGKIDPHRLYVPRAVAAIQLPAPDVHMPLEKCIEYIKDFLECSMVRTPVNWRGESYQIAEFDHCAPGEWLIVNPQGYVARWTDESFKKTYEQKYPHL